MIEWTGTPAYQQVAGDLRRRIASGEFTDGQLPSLAKIQTQYATSVTVAREAVRVLRADGLVVSHQGKAAFLTPEAPEVAAKSGSPEVAQLRQDLAEVREELNALRERVAELETR